MPRLSVSAALAGRLRLPPVWGEEGMAWVSRTGDLWRVPLSGDCDVGNHIGGHAQAVASVVSRDVARDQPEVRGKRNRTAARSWVGGVSHGVDLASQVEARDDSSGAGQAFWRS